LKVLLNYHKQCQQVFAVFFKLNPEFQGCERITSWRFRQVKQNCDWKLKKLELALNKVNGIKLITSFLLRKRLDEKNIKNV